MKHIEKPAGNVHDLGESVFINMIDNLYSLNLKQEFAQSEYRTCFSEIIVYLDVPLSLQGISISVIPGHYL